MPSSSIAWLDFSEAERRQMVEIIALFKESDTRDELGLAPIRDGFADLFFPGTSTLQTRARYFLFIPWLYRGYEKNGVQAIKIEARLRQDEIALIAALGRSGETDGVIGQISGASLQRFPSSIYWIGLQTWGIARFPGTQQQYQRSLDHWHEHRCIRSEVDEINQDDGFQPNWDAGLPDKPAGFPTQASFALTRPEACFLRDRLQLSCTESLLAYLVEHTQLTNEAILFPWLHPTLETFPPRLQDWLMHARNFSEALHGAALLYNLELSEKSKNEERVLTYQEKMQQWHVEISVRQAAWAGWDRAKFWQLAGRPGIHVPVWTRTFVDEWLDCLIAHGQITRPEINPEMRALVEKRERHLKGARSRFENARYLELWSGAAGTGQLEYRWRVARRITDDILSGLTSGEEETHALAG